MRSFWFKQCASGWKIISNYGNYPPTNDETIMDFFFSCFFFIFFSHHVDRVKKNVEVVMFLIRQANTLARERSRRRRRERNCRIITGRWSNVSRRVPSFAFQKSEAETSNKATIGLSADEILVIKKSLLSLPTHSGWPFMTLSISWFFSFVQIRATSF